MNAVLVGGAVIQRRWPLPWASEPIHERMAVVPGMLTQSPVQGGVERYYGFCCNAVRPDVRLRSPVQEKVNPSSFELEGFMMEPLVRFELTTVRLQGGCSTTELKRHGR